MKKLLFTAGTVAVLALASCSNDETIDSSLVNSDQIRYSVVTNNPTRANTLYHSGETLPSFQLWTRFVDGEYAGQAYFENDQIATYGSTNSEYRDMTATRYWTGDALDFLAYAEKNNFARTGADAGSFAASLDPGTANANDAVLTVSGVSLNNDAAEQNDMLYSVAFNQAKSVESTTGDGTYVENEVKMNFRHAFAQLVFQFQNINSGIQVKVDEIRLVGIETTGTVEIKASTADNYKYLGDQSLDEIASLTNRCQWISRGNLNVLGENGKPKLVDGRKNWAFEKMTGSKLTLNNGEAAKLFYASTGELPVYPTAVPSEDAIKEAVEAANADQDEIDAIADETDKTAAQEKKDAAIAKVTGEGEYATYVTEDGGVYAFDEDAYKAAVAQYNSDLAAYNAALTQYTKDNWAQSTSNAMFVIPQDIVPGEIPSTATHLSDVKGMYFLIKCSIQNIADASAGTPRENDVYLHYGEKDAQGNITTKFVLVPVRWTSYSLDGEAEGTDELKAWEPGKKYVYTIIFGAPGSNGGIPTIDPGDENKPDPEEEGDDDLIDPDDPDNPTPINPNTPTLTVIKYNLEAFTIDCWADGRDTNVNVTVNGSEITSDSGTGAAGSDQGSEGGSQGSEGGSQGSEGGSQGSVGGDQGSVGGSQGSDGAPD